MDFRNSWEDRRISGFHWKKTDGFQNFIGKKHAGFQDLI